MRNDTKTNQTKLPWRVGDRPRNRMRGATVVELAILAPVLFLLSLGAIELGRGVWTKHTLTYVAREAARYASVRSSTSDDPATADKIASRARSEIVGIDPEAVGVEVTWKPGNVPGGAVRVRLTYDFQALTSLVPFATLQLSSESEQIISF